MGSCPLYCKAGRVHTILRCASRNLAPGQMLMFSLLPLFWEAKRGERVWLRLLDGREMLSGLQSPKSAKQGCSLGFPSSSVGPNNKKPPAWSPPGRETEFPSWNHFITCLEARWFVPGSPAGAAGTALTPTSFPGRWREETPHSLSQGQKAGVSHGILQLGQIITGHLSVCL